MKIVRIAENAINVYVSKKDLASRNLAADTLHEGSHDFDKLVWDAIDHANIEFDHEFEDRQLNIVNKHDGNGGLVFTISHDKESDYGDEEYIEDPNSDINKKIDKIFITSLNNKNKIDASSGPDADDDFSEYDEYDDDEFEDDTVTSRSDIKDKNMRRMSAVLDMSPEEFSELFRRIHVQSQDAQPPKQQAPAAKKADNTQQQQQRTLSPIKFSQPPRKNSAVSDWDVLIFPEMNDMLEFFARNKSFKSIASSLYTYRGAYYLVLKPNARNLNALNRLESLVIDYNATYLPAESFLPLLKERGTVIMETGAISKLINNFEL